MKTLKQLWRRLRHKGDDNGNINCVGCDMCTNCIDCTNCFDCDNCIECKNCDECTNCINSQLSEKCTNCINVIDYHWRMDFVYNNVEYGITEYINKDYKNYFWSVGDKLELKYRTIKVFKRNCLLGIHKTSIGTVRVEIDDEDTLNKYYVNILYKEVKKFDNDLKAVKWLNKKIKEKR